MFGMDSTNPIEIKITLGLIQDEGVQKALGELMVAMGKAQASINAKMEQEYREQASQLRGVGLPSFRKS